jgi:glycosyltransferase involved in cell wall biosynthesis
MQRLYDTSVTAVIPAYNEAVRIGKVIEEASLVVSEVIVIDDASTDDTRLSAEKAGATVITLPFNSGYISAIKTGFQHANGNIIVTLDADGELSPKYIPALIAPIIEDKADMTQGHRNSISRPSERFLNWLANTRVHVGDSGTGLRAVRADLAKTLELRGACICGIFALEVASKGGRILEIPIHLNNTEKPRKIAWYHFRQFFYLLPWLIK